MKHSFLVLAGLAITSLAARADTIRTYDVSASYTDGGSVTGTITLDSTTGVFSSAALAARGFPAGDDADFTQITFNPYASDIYVSDGMHDEVLFFLPVYVVLQGYSAPFIPSDVSLFGYADKAQVSHTISITEASAVTPEPSSLALLGTGLLGILALARRRLNPSQCRLS